MTEMQPGDRICWRCPMVPPKGVTHVPGIAEGCPAPTVVERVGAAMGLEQRGEAVEIVLGRTQRFCGRFAATAIEAAVGDQTTENRIIETDLEDNVRTIVVASGPANLLTRLYGSPPRDMPGPAPVESGPSGEQPRLQVVSDTMKGVHAQIDEAVRLLVGIDLPGLSEEGTARGTRLATEIDGTSNHHALAMQAAAAALLLDLRASISAANEFYDQVRQYKRSTSGE